MLEAIYLAVASVMAALSLLFVASAWALLRLARRRAGAVPSAYQPHVTLVIPCKGVDEGLADTLAAHLRHDYPSYEVLFAVADADDPAVAVIREQMAARPQVPARVVLTSRLPNCVDAIANVLGAVAEADSRSEVFAFADSDGLPRDSQWLRSLVAPLEAGGVSTGFRWYLPTERWWISGNLQSAWDSAWLIYHAFGGTAWGGAMAFTRKVYEQLNLKEHLSRGLTGDLVVTLQAWAARQPVHFAPGAMVSSECHPGFRAFLPWAVRQSLLIRLQAPPVYWRGFSLATVYGCFFLLTAALFVWPGETYGRMLPGVALAFVFLVSLLRGQLRYTLLTQLFPALRGRVRPLRWHYTWAVILSDLLTPFIAYRALFTRTVRWRGVAYRKVGDRAVRVHEQVGARE